MGHPPLSHCIETAWRIWGPQAGQPIQYQEGVGRGYPCFLKEEAVKLQRRTAAGDGLSPTPWWPASSCLAYGTTHRDKPALGSRRHFAVPPVLERKPAQACFLLGGWVGQKIVEKFSERSATAADDVGWMFYSQFRDLDSGPQAAVWVGHRLNWRHELCGWTLVARCWSAGQHSSVLCCPSRAWYAELAWSQVAGPWSYLGVPWPYLGVLACSVFERPSHAAHCRRRR